MQTTAWQGPPSDILGHPVPIQQFCVRTDRVVVVLQQILAFPEGCSLSLHVAVRRGSLDEPAWRDLLESDAHGSPYHTPAEADLKFGVHFSDGSKASTADQAFRTFRGGAHAADRPEAPLLIESDRQSSSNDQFYNSDLRLWLWPLPPPEPFEFVIEWQHMGIDATPTALDGRAILRAAEQAQPYWP